MGELRPKLLAALAKRNIDLAHPKDSPAGAEKPSSVDRDHAVTLGGVLAQINGLPPDAVQAAHPAARTGGS